MGTRLCYFGEQKNKERNGERGKIILGSWFVILFVAFVMSILTNVAFQYSWASFSAVTLLVLAVSYVIITVNVQRSPHSQHNAQFTKKGNYQ